MSLLALIPTRDSSAVLVNGTQENWMDAGEGVGVGALSVPKTEVVLEGAVPDSTVARVMAAFMARQVLPDIPGLPSIGQQHALTISTAVSNSNNTPSGGSVTHTLETEQMRVLFRGLPSINNDSNSSNSNTMECIMLTVGLRKFFIEAKYLGDLLVGSIRRLVCSSQAALDFVNPRLPVPESCHSSYLDMHICVMSRTYVEELTRMCVTVVLVHQPAHCHATDRDSYVSNAADSCASEVDASDESSYTHIVDVSGLNRRLDGEQLVAELVITPPLKFMWRPMLVQLGQRG